MAEQQPIINYIDNFDALKDYKMEFTYLGSDRITTNQVEIRVDEKNSSPIYSRESTKFDKNHIIPAKTLKNGVSYRARIRVKNQDNSWSVWSPEEVFTCLRTPNVVFENLQEERYVYNDDVLFQAYFQQEQGDRIDTYQFALLDSNHIPITKYPVRRPEENTPNVMQERISNLTKGRLYYLSVRVLTKANIEFLAKHEFVAHYVAPSTSGIIEAKNDHKNGLVLVQSYLQQSIGIQVVPKIENQSEDNNVVIPMDYIYIDDDKIVIPPHRPLMYSRLGMAEASDFVMKIWCQNIANGLMLELITEHRNGIGIKLYKEDDRIIMVKEFLNDDDNGIKSMHTSNVIPALGKKSFYLYLKVIEFRSDIYIELEQPLVGT